MQANNINKKLENREALRAPIRGFTRRIMDP